MPGDRLKPLSLDFSAAFEGMFSLAVVEAQGLQPTHFPIPPPPPAEPCVVSEGAGDKDLFDPCHIPGALRGKFVVLSLTREKR